MIISDLQKEFKQNIVPVLFKERGYTNINQVPKVTKVVINSCVGSSAEIKNDLETIIHDIGVISGQRPVKTKAKESISNFKLRKGQEIGCKVTLRGSKMYEFLLRLTRIALPRIRDFRGISNKAFDGRGGYTLGVKDHSIFPEIEIDKVKKTVGMDITIVTTAKDKEETKALLSHLGMPFVDKKPNQS